MFDLLNIRKYIIDRVEGQNVYINKKRSSIEEFNVDLKAGCCQVNLAHALKIFTMRYRDDDDDDDKAIYLLAFV